MPGVTQTEFAKLRGVTKGRVSQWKTANMLVLNDDGSVDVEASNAKLNGGLDAAKRAAWKLTESAAALGAETSPEAPPKADGVAPPDPRFSAYNDARAAKEQELAILARMNREEREGALVRKSEVEAGADAIAEILQRGLESLPAMVAPKLAAESDAVAVESILRVHIRQLRTELAKACARRFNVPSPEVSNA